MKTIYKNGAVYTGKLPLVEAFAVEDGKFVFAGSSAEADALAAAGDKVVDLGGKFVCSGFNDSHMHLLNYGSSLLKAQLAAHTESLEDMLACLDTFQKEHPRKDGAWPTCRTPCGPSLRRTPARTGHGCGAEAGIRITSRTWTACRTATILTAYQLKFRSARRERAATAS